MGQLAFYDSSGILVDCQEVASCPVSNTTLTLRNGSTVVGCGIGVCPQHYPVTVAATSESSPIECLSNSSTCLVTLGVETIQAPAFPFSLFVGGRLSRCLPALSDGANCTGIRGFEGPRVLDANSKLVGCLSTSDSITAACPALYAANMSANACQEITSS